MSGNPGRVLTKYHVADRKLFYGDKELGPASQIAVDGREGTLATVAETSDSAYRAGLEVGDVVGVTVGKVPLVFGIESKLPEDLSNSRRNRRLQKELRALRESVDVPILGLRLKAVTGDGFYDFGGNVGYTLWRDEEKEILDAIAHWSTCFGPVVFLPANDAGVLRFAHSLRSVLAGGREVYNILAGAPKRAAGTTPFTVALQGMGLWIGNKRAQALEAYYRGDFIQCINAPLDEWYSIVRDKGVVERLEKLRSYRK